jgi:hypothetical protein
MEKEEEIKMNYSIQHNNKGKLHLIGDNDIECGSSGVFLCTGAESVVFENGKFYTIFNVYPVVSKQLIFESDYCKKCLNKIRNKK